MMTKKLYKNQTSIILPFLIGGLLGVLAKLVDTPEIASTFPVFDDMFGRFGIWICTATIIAISSKKPALAALRTFCFFLGMLLTYYGYTILFLGFFPKSQIILWGIISIFTPACGFIIWFVHENKWFAPILSSLPFVIIFTEWYITGQQNILLLIMYLCMTFSLLIILRTPKQRIISLILAFVIAFVFIQSGIAANLYEHLLNI